MKETFRDAIGFDVNKPYWTVVFETSKRGDWTTLRANSFQLVWENAVEWFLANRQAKIVKTERVG